LYAGMPAAAGEPSLRAAHLLDAGSGAG